MEVLIKLGKWKGSGIKISVPSPDCSVADVLAEVRRQLPPFLTEVLLSSKRSGSRVFLTLEADVPERLSETKSLRDYVPTGDSCTLWLMCAHVGGSE